MTEKRYSYFKSEFTGLYVISDEKHKETFSGIDEEYNCSRVVRKLNILTDENEQLKQQVKDLYESDKSLRKFASNMTLNYTGICVPRRLFIEVISILKDIEHNDLVEDLSKESIDTSTNGC